MWLDSALESNLFRIIKRMRYQDDRSLPPTQQESVVFAIVPVQEWSHSYVDNMYISIPFLTITTWSCMLELSPFHFNSRLSWRQWAKFSLTCDAPYWDLGRILAPYGFLGFLH